MTYKTETPFDGIESSHEYVALLADTIERLDTVADMRALSAQLAPAVEQRKRA